MHYIDRVEFNKYLYFLSNDLGVKAYIGLIFDAGEKHGIYPVTINRSKDCEAVAGSSFQITTSIVVRFNYPTSHAKLDAICFEMENGVLSSLSYYINSLWHQPSVTSGLPSLDPIFLQMKAHALVPTSPFKSHQVVPDLTPTPVTACDFCGQGMMHVFPLMVVR